MRCSLALLFLFVACQPTAARPVPPAPAADPADASIPPFFSADAAPRPNDAAAADAAEDAQVAALVPPVDPLIDMPEIPTPSPINGAFSCARIRTSTFDDFGLKHHNRVGLVRDKLVAIDSTPEGLAWGGILDLKTLQWRAVNLQGAPRFINGNTYWSGPFYPLDTRIVIFGETSYVLDIEKNESTRVLHSSPRPRNTTSTHSPDFTSFKLSSEFRSIRALYGSAPANFGS